MKKDKMQNEETRTINPPVQLFLHSAFCILHFLKMTAPNHNWRKFKNAFMQTLASACAILVVTPLVLIFYHVIQ